VNSSSPFILCDIKFANTHYLITEKEIRKDLMVLDTIQKVILLSEVKKIAKTKFGSFEGLAEEKTKRAAKSEANWITKCVIARVQNTKEPPMPKLVRRENNKANPHVC
jgi:hypothetical protein